MAASQSVPLDLAALRPDFVVGVGYKWLPGPFGAGYRCVAEQHRLGEPIEQNWILRDGSEDFIRLVVYRDDYRPGARRFNVGERTKFELLPMAIAELQQLRSWRIQQITDVLSGLTGTIAAQALEVGLDPLPADQRGPTSLRADILPALAAVNCFAAVRGGSLRISSAPAHHRHRHA